MSTVSFGTSSPTVRTAIIERVNLDLSGIELNKVHQDFVVVSFCIKDSQIQVIDSQGTQKELIDLILVELSEIDINTVYSDRNVYNYKFVFRKI
jgi:hypothetical protein